MNAKKQIYISFTKWNISSYGHPGVYESHAFLEGELDSNVS